MRPDRVHHPPKDRSLVTEALPNKSTIVTHRAANGKPLSVIARIPVPEKGSATAKRKTVRSRSELLEQCLNVSQYHPPNCLKQKPNPTAWRNSCICSNATGCPLDCPRNNA